MSTERDEREYAALEDRIATDPHWVEVTDAEERSRFRAVRHSDEIILVPTVTFRDGRLFAEAHALAVWRHERAPHPPKPEPGRIVAGLREQLRTAERDAARYRWLRNGNAYAPEEVHVRGGNELDEICDDGIAEDGVAANAGWGEPHWSGTPRTFVTGPIPGAAESTGGQRILDVTLTMDDGRVFKLGDGRLFVNYAPKPLP